MSILARLKTFWTDQMDRTFDGTAYDTGVPHYSELTRAQMIERITELGEINSKLVLKSNNLTIAGARQDDRIAELEGTIERLSARGIEDMQDEIRQLQATIERVRGCMRYTTTVEENNRLVKVPCLLLDHVLEALGDKV